MSENFPMNFFFKSNNDAQNILNNETLKNIDSIEKDLSQKTINNEISHSENVEISQDVDNFSQEELQSLTNEILSFIKNSISPQKFNAYYKSTFTVSKFEEGFIQFAVTTNFIKKMIEQHNISHIKEAIAQLLGQDFDFEIIVVSSAQSLSSNNKNVLNAINNEKKSFTEEFVQNKYKVTQGKSAADTRFSINDFYPSKEDIDLKIESKVIDHENSFKIGKQLNKNQTFDNFVIGQSNNFAHASAYAVASNPGKTYPSLYIYGNSGLGKTHLLHAIANHIQEKFPTFRICITTAKDFYNEMVDAIKNNDINSFRKSYSENLDVLMIDDIHELKNKNRTQDEFFYVFNELHNNGKQLVFTSDKYPNQIDGIEERIRTRLSWGMVVEIDVPDLETRMAILKKKVSDEDLYIPEDVMNLIARSVNSNIRDLESSLIRLGAYSSFYAVDVDIEIAKEQLKLEDIETTKAIITLESIANAVSNFYKIPVADLISKSRNKEITYARHISMYLSYVIIKPTYKCIGKFYGKRDHSSVMHGIEKITNLIKTDPKVNEEVTLLKNKF